MLESVEENIRKIRELKSYSQEYVAGKLDLSVRAYSKIENGETQLTINRLNQISEILEVTPQQVLGFDERFIFSHCENPVGMSGTNHNEYYAFSEKERMQYEERISHLEEEVSFLRKQLEKVLSS